jgi:hypothetical protein
LAATFVPKHASQQKQSLFRARRARSAAALKNVKNQDGESIRSGWSSPMQRLLSVFNERAFTDWSKLLSNSLNGASGDQLHPELGAACSASRNGSGACDRFENAQI